MGLLAAVQGHKDNVLLANIVNKELKMEGGRVSGLASQQDGGQFEDALRRLHALEKKLTDQVQVDITELRSKWVQPRVERVTNNTFKLWQVRENLKLSKVLYVEEERLLGEFKKVKDALITASMDDEYFEATKDTCVFLGGKLTEVRNKQLLCYSASKDLETAVNKDIMTIRFEDKDYADLDLEQVRASTPLREMEPTPLDRHRSKSREPSPLTFTMPPMRLSSGTTTPGGSNVGDPHAYFSRPGSSQSLHGGRGPTTDRERKQDEEFRAKLAAMQADDDSPPTGRKLGVPSQGIVCRSASGKVIKDDPVDFATMSMEPTRPGSAMSECSIQLPGDVSRPGSRMDQMLGDELSRSLLDLTTSGNLQASPAHNASYSSGFPQGKNMLDDLDVEINLGEDAATKREEEEEASRKAAEAMAEKIRADAKKQHEEKEKEEKKKADDKKMADMAEKRRIAAEQKAEEEAKKKEEEARKKEEEKQKKLEAKAKKEAEEKKKEDEKLAKEAEKKAKLEEKKRKMEEAEENTAMEEALKMADMAEKRRIAAEQKA